MKKRLRYQDYVIKEGELVGEFEEMYKDFDDPWEQSKESLATEKQIILNYLKNSNAQKVLELGCGLGFFTNEISKLGIKPLGVDISNTAIRKASEAFPECSFESADILDYSVYQNFKPDVIIMAEITWYVLDQLDDFIRFLKEELPDTVLIHTLTLYPADSQSYGGHKFKSMNEILDYFDFEYLEFGEIWKGRDQCRRMYFITSNHADGNN